MFAALSFLAAMNTQHVDPPMPYGATPSAAQLKWHELEFYGFLHFTTNTFTDKEWGFGDESPEIFNPTEFDADQIILSLKSAGMKAAILTCKHHDGFCLWDSKHTTHDVASSPWKNGKGDVVREISDACRRHGLRFGVYLSPWDRNYPKYGGPEYVEYYRAQMKELLTEYGDVFEFWCDGANGGDGYYGGANETRRIDRSTYYDWVNTWQVAYDLQPNVVVFSDIGPQVRWIGNESGVAGDPCWATYTPKPKPGMTQVAPGEVQHEFGFNGTRNGKYWIPGEVDVSIRPGWFYHESQDDQVRSPENLIDMYFGSVGQGASFLLNVPPDRRGLVHENDQASLAKMGEILRATFDVNLADGATVAASNERGRGFGAKNVLDGSRDTYWATEDDETTPWIVMTLPEVRTFNVVSIREHLPLGQRIDDWALDALINGKWREIGKGTAIGSRRLWRGDYVTTDQVRLRITKSPVCPAISELALYSEPALVQIEAGSTTFLGMTSVVLSAPADDVEVRYTTDGSQPTTASSLYKGPIEIDKTCTLKTAAFRDGTASPRLAEMAFTAYSAATLLQPSALPANAAAGATVHCYEGGWQTLDQLEGKTPIRTISSTEISIDHRTRDEHFALVFHAWFEAKSDGLYQFSTSSDDGSRLWIGDTMVVDNDGLHGMGEVEGLVGLSKGWHKIKIAYFNAAGGRGLEVSWAGPDTPKTSLNGAQLKHG
jgi:alpha-L-fucosidase